MSQNQGTNQYAQNEKTYIQITSLEEDRHDYTEAIEILASNIQGELILPGHPAYEAGRKVWNGSFDRYPAAIVRCLDTEDVRTAVNVAREHGMALSVRSGGHSAAGHGTNTGGLVIDLSQMKAITVDPVHQTARLEPGLTWGEVAEKLQPFGLALTAGDVASVGVGGLLLSGGIG